MRLRTNTSALSSNPGDSPGRRTAAGRAKGRTEDALRRRTAATPFARLLPRASRVRALAHQVPDGPLQNTRPERTLPLPGAAVPSGTPVPVPRLPARREFGPVPP